MFIKRVTGGSQKKRLVYLQLVEGYRDKDGRVRHRILATLGREDELVRTGQIQRLIESLKRCLVEGQKTLKAKEKGEPQRKRQKKDSRTRRRRRIRRR